MAPACLYLACKAEESQLQAKLLFYAMRKVAGGHGRPYELPLSPAVTLRQQPVETVNRWSGMTLRKHCDCADKYPGMPAMDARVLTDMELLVLVSQFRADNCS